MNSQKKEHVTITKEDVINIADENVSKLIRENTSQEITFKYLKDIIKSLTPSLDNKKINELQNILNTCISKKEKEEYEIKDSKKNYITQRIKTIMMMMMTLCKYII